MAAAEIVAGAANLRSSHAKGLAGGLAPTSAQVAGNSNHIARGRIRRSNLNAQPASRVSTASHMKVAQSGFEAWPWQGFVVPAKTPDAVIGKLRDTYVAAVADPVVRQKLIDAGAELLQSSPQEMADHMRKEAESS